MGLFSRNNPDSYNAETNGRDDFDQIDLPTSDDLKGGLFTSDEPKVAPAPVSAPAKRNTPLRSAYGIEDAIKLMRSLPRDNNEVVVTVVKKTLESTHVRVPDIVEDANQKEARIRNQHKTLEGEIKELQDQIAQRNQQISDLLHDLKETTDVRQRLQLAMELDGEVVSAKQHPPQQQEADAASADPVSNSVAPNTAPARPQTATGAVDANQRRRVQQRPNSSH